MLCPRCKNPNDDCAIFCQWCGARCAPDPQPQKNPKGKTLKQLIKDGDLLLATQLYIEDTGATVKEAQSYIKEFSKQVREAENDKSFWKYWLIFMAVLGLLWLIVELVES
jgi:hypothetical protein